MKFWIDTDSSEIIELPANVEDAGENFSGPYDSEVEAQIALDLMKYDEGDSKK